MRGSGPRSATPPLARGGLAFVAEHASAAAAPSVRQRPRPRTARDAQALRSGQDSAWRHPPSVRTGLVWQVCRLTLLHRGASEGRMTTVRIAAFVAISVYLALARPSDDLKTIKLNGRDCGPEGTAT